MAETDLTGAWGILGGAFDPVHNGHLQLAGDCYRIKKLQKVLLVPSFTPPHKESTDAPFRDRVTMIRLAIEGQTGFEVSEIEKELEGPGYTLHLVRELKERHPERRWAFIIGADNIQDMKSWHKPEDIFREVDVIAGARPGYELDTEHLPDTFDIEIVKTGEIDISGTELRRKLSGGMDVEELKQYVPDAVAEYIQEHGLYRS